MSIGTININVDEKCDCGTTGVCENGMCMACNSKRLSKLTEERSKMASVELNLKALEEAKREACAILDQNWVDICAMRDLSAINYAKAGKDGKFSFKVNVGITQMPKGSEIDIKANIQCSAALSDEYEYTTVDLEQDLPLD